VFCLILFIFSINNWHNCFIYWFSPFLSSFKYYSF